MIPNIIHFLFFGTTDFEFIHYLSILSAYHTQKPDIIYLYNQNEPVDNFYWETAKQYVTIVKMTPPNEFRGVKLDSYQYKSDIVRMERLIEQGGIYMDIDVLCLKSYTHLLEGNTCVLGVENSPSQTTLNLSEIDSVTNAVLMCEPGHPYIKTWYNAISDNIVGKPWAYHAVCLPKVLLEQGEYDTHLEPRRSFMPFCFRDDFIFDPNRKNEVNRLEHSYTIHLWETIWLWSHLKQLNVNFLHTKDTVFSDLFRQYTLELAENYDKLISMIIKCQNIEQRNNLLEIKAQLDQHRPKRKPTMTYCTTCYNRFWQLKETLPRNLERISGETGVDMVVVNFRGDDSDEMETWVKENLGQYLESGVLKFYTRNRPFDWNVAIAKNVSHRLAQGDILVNLDCDNYIQENDVRIIKYYFESNNNILLHMSKHNKNTIGFLLQLGINVPEKYHHLDQDELGDVGRMVTTRKTFFDIGGYNEQMQFMGFEDTDLLLRICKNGSAYIHIPPNMNDEMSNIPNPEAHDEYKAKWWKSFTYNRKLSFDQINNNNLKVNVDGYKENLDDYEIIQ